nr:uncharacterized protein LOC111419893 [Onthophagus taurus]
MKPYNRVKHPISPGEKLALTLRFLATGESYRSLSFAYRISHSYISVFIPIVLQTLCKKLMPILLPPPSEMDLKQKAEEFWNRWNFPNVIAGIDGKHVRVMAPDNSGSLFFNYKNYFSIVLLALVDANYKFLYVDIGSYGKEGDAGIFAKSKIGKQIYGDKFNFPLPALLPRSKNTILPYVILGDDAFKLDKHVMKPYPKKQIFEDPKKTIFNYRLSRARRVTENAFGIHCHVFRIFFSPINVKPNTVDLIVLTCCCLRNMLRTEYILNNQREIFVRAAKFSLRYCRRLDRTRR